MTSAKRLLLTPWRAPQPLQAITTPPSTASNPAPRVARRSVRQVRHCARTRVTLRVPCWPSAGAASARVMLKRPVFGIWGCAGVGELADIELNAPFQAGQNAVTDAWGGGVRKAGVPLVRIRHACVQRRNAGCSVAPIGGGDNHGREA